MFSLRPHPGCRKSRARTCCARLNSTGDSVDMELKRRNSTDSQFNNEQFSSIRNQFNPREFLCFSIRLTPNSNELCCRACSRLFRAERTASAASVVLNLKAPFATVCKSFQARLTKQRKLTKMDEHPTGVHPSYVLTARAFLPYLHCWLLL